MLTNMKEMLSKAKENNYAVAQFNINNLEWSRFILEACEESAAPVILGASEGAIKYMGGYKTVFNIVNSLVSDLNITIPVCLHLDHGSSIESCKNAIDNGFTSVMIDASKLNINENIEVTKEVVNYACMFNVTVEAEVGAVGGEEDGIANEMMYAKLEDAIKIVKEANVSFLAAALGSVHGLYQGEPKLDFIKMKEINENINIPLVLHGGSGIPDDLIKESIKNGVCKINLNTELQIEWSKKVRNYLNENPNVYDPRKIIKSGEEAIKQFIKDKLILFGSSNKAQ